MENNKLIADFMGWKLEKVDYDDGSGGCYYIFNRYEKGEIVETYSGGDSWSLGESSTIPFDKSWDWLMTVVKAIVHVALFSDVQNIAGKALDMVCEYPVTIEREKLHSKCVDFINWYNSQRAGQVVLKDVEGK